LRQIGTLPKGVDPKVFAAYLLTLGMKTRIDEQSDGFTLWIYNEDHFEQARDELRGYLSQPEDPRYRDAIQMAESIRRKEQQLDKRYRKNFREVSDLWAYPGFRRRPLTYMLVAICVVVFVWQHSTPPLAVEHRLAFSAAYRGPDGELRDNGLTEIRGGEIWRLVTPIFMHGSILHIFFNMWWLSALGTMIEIRRGTLRLAGLVLVSAVVSNLGQYVWMERTVPGGHHVFEGMSGVVYALFGYVWMKGLYEPEQMMIMHPNNVNIMLLWLVLCMTGVIGPIANAAHVVGMVVGIVFGVLRY
jgi:GlpG protein